MASPRLRRLRNLLLTLSLLGCGLWLASSALWQLGKTAIYVHESVIVTGTVIDVRQKPFETWAETLGKGNWSMPGDISYQPHVRFELPGGIDAIRLDLEADNTDYHTGDTISIISPPGQPGKAHINRWKFLWGASCMRLGLGSLLALIGYALLCRLRGKRPTRAALTPKRPAKQAENTPARKTSPPHKRKAAGKGGSAPRRSKKADSPPQADAEATKKPRRSRKKKDAPRQGELPL